MSSNYKALFDSYMKLEKNFPSIFTIPSEGGLWSIYFCFKNKIEIKDYLEKFKINKEIIEKISVIEYSVVKLFVNDILSKVQDMTDEKKRLKIMQKKYRNL